MNCYNNISSNSSEIRNSISNSSIKAKSSSMDINSNSDSSCCRVIDTSTTMIEKVEVEVITTMNHGISKATSEAAAAMTEQ